MNDETERLKMVQVQLEERGIRDPRVLAAMARVPRQRFVPARLRDRATEDGALPIGEGQTISQPYIVGSMTEAAEIRASDRVLEIGTGSGYGASVLAELAQRVYTVERHSVLASRAEGLLKELGYQNIEVRCGDGTLGWVEAAPFDAILVTAGGPETPGSLRDQLAIGGRLVMPVGSSLTQQDLLRVRRTGIDDYETDDLGLVVFVPLVGDEGWSERDIDERRRQ